LNPIGKAAEINGEKIGVGRLVKLDRDHGEIGGLYVTPEYRGKQVASGFYAANYDPTVGLSPGNQ